MHRFISIVSLLVAMFALLSPSFATGVCVVQGGVPVVSTSAGDVPVHLPNPCDMQGGKRVLPEQPDFRRHAVLEDPRTIAAQWARSMMDEPSLEGRSPAMELPPPRAS
jgi:hypothetical protein